MLLIWKFSTDQSWKMRVLIKSLRNNTAEDTKMIFKSLIGRQIKGKAKQIFQGLSPKSVTPPSLLHSGLKKGIFVKTVDFLVPKNRLFQTKFRKVEHPRPILKKCYLRLSQITLQHCKKGLPGQNTRSLGDLTDLQDQCPCVPPFVSFSFSLLLGAIVLIGMKYEL